MAGGCHLHPPPPGRSGHARSYRGSLISNNSLNQLTKDNLTLQYFDAEMRYLREAGKAFAEEFPKIAAQLNLDKPGALDPSVEQLFPMPCTLR